MKYVIQLLEFPWMHTYYIPWQILIKIWIRHFTISQVPFVFTFLSHTLFTYKSHSDSTRHIICLTYFSCKIRIPETGTVISKFLMSLHQLPVGWSIALYTPAEWTSCFIIGQRSMTFPGHLRAPWNHSSSRLPYPPPTRIPLTTWHIQSSLSSPTQSLDKWNRIIF